MFPARQLCTLCTNVPFLFVPFLSLFMEGGGSFDVQDYSSGAATAFGPDGDFAAFCKGLEKLRL
jgi:hypothetical protein